MAESGKSGNAKSGVLASETDIVHVTSWTMTEICATSRRGTSDSGGFKKTWPGVRSASGEVRVLYDETVESPKLVSGDTTSLVLYLDGSDKITIPAVINSRALEVDLDDGVVIGEVLGYESDGAWLEVHA